MKKGPTRTILPGLKLGHVVEEQQVEVRVGGQDAAFALLERIGDLNRSRFLPVIERVFDEFDRPGQIVRIDRLDLDLGMMKESELGGAGERLTAVLRDALRKAMPPPGAELMEAPSPFASRAATRAVGDALADAFLHYLLRGVWPYGSALDTSTAPAELLERLIETEPAALAAMLRRHGRSEALLQRLVHQMRPELLEQLLAVLEPADSAWILVYMGETRASHLEEPLVDESPDEFERLLWTIVLRDALHRAGLRANRRAFVRSMIERIAESGSASFGELIALLGRGLVAVPGTGLGTDSLLSIIRELDSEERSAAPPGPMSFAELAGWLEGRLAPRSRVGRAGAGPAEPEKAGPRRSATKASGPERAALAEALRSRPTEASWLLRRLIREDGAKLLSRLEGLLSAEQLAHLLLPAAEARAVEARLKRARGAGTQARLLLAVLRDGGPGPEADSVAGSGSSKAGREARTEPSRGRDEAGTQADDRFLSPLERVERALSPGSERDPVEWQDALSRAVAAAAAADPVGLRRLMRRFALADPIAFVERAAGTLGTEAAFVQLLPASTGAVLASLVEAASCTPAETARLVHLAATMPVSSSPAGLIRSALALLAGNRGINAETIFGSLLERARESGGAAGRDLVRSLEQSAEPPIRPDDPEARRAATLDALRYMLIAPGTWLDDGAPGAAQLSGLSGLSAAALRDALGAQSLDLKAAAAALALLDETALTRLVLLLAPGRGAPRADLRHRLHRSRSGVALAAIAAELLVAGAIKPEKKSAVLSIRPRRPRGAAELRLVERALRAGGDALEAPDVRAALSRLLAERPFELIRLLASPGVASDATGTIVGSGAAVTGRGFGAASPLLRDPLALALAFGGLPASERGLATALAMLLAGPGGRSAIAPERAASALARAAASMLGRPSGQGLAARWLGEMLRAASLSEQASLRRLIAARWPGKAQNNDMLVALGLRPAGADVSPPAPTPKRELKGRADRAGANNFMLDAPGLRPAGADASPRAPTPKRELKGRAGQAEAGGEGERATDKGSIAWLHRMLRDRPPGYVRLLRRLLSNARAREMLCRVLPETLLVRLVAAIASEEARSLVSAAELIAKALAATGGGTATRAACWSAVLAVAARNGGIEDLLRHLFDGGARPGLRAPTQPDSLAFWSRLGALAEARGHPQLRTALDELAYDRRKAAARRPAAPAPEQDRLRDVEAKVERKLWEGADEEAGLRIAIANAGLVLAAPFLPQFFERLDLLDPASSEKKGWRSRQARDRGIHLLQYLVEGRCDRPEPVLALNKLLCGQTLGYPVSASIEPTQAERDICRSLLDAIVAAWPMLKGSSVEALQETFLQREGRIVRIEAGWRVDVERKVLDVMVDSVPWGFSMILHPWMEEPVSVEW